MVATVVIRISRVSQQRWFPWAQRLLLDGLKCISLSAGIKHHIQNHQKFQRKISWTMLRIQRERHGQRRMTLTCTWHPQRSKFYCSRVVGSAATFFMDFEKLIVSTTDFYVDGSFKRRLEIFLRPAMQRRRRRKMRITHRKCHRHVFFWHSPLWVLSSLLSVLSLHILMLPLLWQY